jgi:hypothetical protein
VPHGNVNECAVSAPSQQAIWRSCHWVQSCRRARNGPGGLVRRPFVGKAAAAADMFCRPLMTLTCHRLCIAALLDNLVGGRQ